MYVLENFTWTSNKIIIPYMFHVKRYLFISEIVLLSVVERVPSLYVTMQYDC
jgi:hypothetical protein